MKELSYLELIQFYQNQLPPKCRDEVLLSILAEPLYAEVLQGFQAIESQLVNGLELNTFLEAKQKELYNKIFPNL